MRNTEDMVRKTTLLFGSALLVALTSAPVLAGGGFGGDPVMGKISGPAVSAIMVVDPTFGSPTLGQSAIRLQKGTASSGALFVNREAINPIGGWQMGCDGLHGAAVAGTANITAVNQLRFVNNRMRSYVPAATLASLFAALGVQLDEFHRIPAITDIDSAVCTPVVENGITKWELSFTAVIQFEDSTK